MLIQMRSIGLQFKLLTRHFVLCMLHKVILHKQSTSLADDPIFFTQI